MLEHDKEDGDGITISVPSYGVRLSLAGCSSAEPASVSPDNSR